MIMFLSILIVQSFRFRILTSKNGRLTIQKQRREKRKIAQLKYEAKAHGRRNKTRHFLNPFLKKVLTFKALW